MYEVMIREYLKKLTVKDINSFANKNNISLKDGEDKILYDFIMKNWLIIYKGNPTDIFNSLKQKISNNTYNNVINLYREFKNKIST